MRRAVWIPLLSVVIGLAGCNAFIRGGGGGGHPLKKVTRPISIILLQKNSTCVVKFSGRTHHAFKDDDIAWEFTNTCADNQTVVLSTKTSANPFTDTAGSWTLSSIRSGDTDDKTLTVSQAAATGVEYGFNITVGGVKYDPKLEIDP